jgi:putative Ca2+/H+ antiporter (TMEM165/GDT1 family)
MSLGWSVVAPGDRTRLAALQTAAREVVVIVFGAAVMLLMAAGIEAYWSSSALSSTVKRSLGAGLFLAVALYMTLVGRGDASNTRARGLGKTLA